MSARDVWDELLGGGWDCLVRWRDNSQPETHHLEFKPGWIDDGDIPDAVLGELARGVSGFANVDGGVMVFGVKTVRGPAKADVLEGISGVKGLDMFAERMRLRIKSITSPAIPGIDLRTFKSPTENDVGVVAVYIPQTLAGPYRAEGKEHSGRYFMRSTNDTLLMPHQILAGMFGRRPVPQLRGGLEFAKDSPHDPGSRDEQRAGARTRHLRSTEGYARPNSRQHCCERYLAKSTIRRDRVELGSCIRSSSRRAPLSR